jgi:UPF0716 protein FxsA
MGFVLLFVMIVIPITEIAVFIEVGGRIGLWPTLATVVLTAMVGTALLRQQGLATLMRARQSLEENRLPMSEVFDGACLLVAGALLLTPGFVTDGAGLLLFVPAVRAALLKGLGRYLAASGRAATWSEPGGPAGPGPQPGRGTTIIDGEFEEVPPEDKDAPGGPGDDGGPRPPAPPRR